MVGQAVIKVGMLDTKRPSRATIGRGWRYQAWKMRRVELVQESDGSALLRFHKNDVLKDVIPLQNVQEVKHVASKTHVNAFEVLSEDKSVIILSGETDMESRDWIWTLKKIFRPQSASSDMQDSMRIRLLPNDHTKKLNLADGDCDITISLAEISVTSSAGANETPVEPFSATSRERLLAYSWPLTTIGRFSLSEDDRVLTMECTPESKCGAAAFQFECFHDRAISMPRLLDYIKLAVFAATNSLHDCISNTHWEYS